MEPGCDAHHCSMYAIACLSWVPTGRALTMCLWQTKNGPLFGGNDVNGLDMMLGPQLKHTMIACKTIKVCACTLGSM